MESELRSRVDQPVAVPVPEGNPERERPRQSTRGENLIISIHIPKTAGTTLASILDYAVSRQILYDYDDQIIPKDPEQIRDIAWLIERFKVIHGHFHYSKYAEIFPEARYVTVLRDPVERTISNYFHLMRSKDMSKFAYRRIVEDGLDIVGFSKLGNMRKAQSIYLNGADLDRFAVVGMTEDMPATVKLIRKILGLAAYHPTMLGRMGFVPKTNVGYGRLLAQFKHGFVTPSVRAKIRENIAPDWELYCKAKERFEALKKEHL
tara:strand:- start:328 stop:1116 length:789 start_codon:yes stop_codon:yes gene_type:complete